MKWSMKLRSADFLFHFGNHFVKKQTEFVQEARKKKTRQFGSCFLFQVSCQELDKMETITYARRDLKGSPDDSDITDYIISKLRNPQNCRPPDLILHSGDDFKFEIHKVST